jgi:hypothetical protein
MSGIKINQTTKDKVMRAPVRKYFDTSGKLIRSEDTSVNKNITPTNPVKPDSNRFFISSMREQLGLSQNQIDGIVRAAEREGRVRRNPDGSYEWL